MKKKGILLVLALGLVVAAWSDEADKAIGYWKSYSDVKGEEGKMTGVWKLALTASGTLEGYVVYAPDAHDGDVYHSKKKEFDGKSVFNTAWMRDLKRSGSDSWGGGSIVDLGSDKGDVYGCEIKVTGGGKKLEMRGFLGISLFGRTQTWLASTEEELKALKDAAAKKAAAAGKG